MALVLPGTIDLSALADRPARRSTTAPDDERLPRWWQNAAATLRSLPSWGRRASN